MAPLASTAIGSASHREGSGACTQDSSATPRLPYSNTKGGPTPRLPCCNINIIIVIIPIIIISIIISIILSNIITPPEEASQLASSAGNRRVARLQLPTWLGGATHGAAQEKSGRTRVCDGRRPTST